MGISHSKWPNLNPSSLQVMFFFRLLSLEWGHQLSHHSSQSMVTFTHFILFSSHSLHVSSSPPSLNSFSSPLVTHFTSLLLLQSLTSFSSPPLASILFFSSSHSLPLSSSPPAPLINHRVLPATATNASLTWSTSPPTLNIIRLQPPNWPPCLECHPST